MNELLRLFAESNSHHYAQFLNNCGYMTMDYRHPGGYHFEMRKSLVAWINSKLLSTHFELSMFTDRKLILSYLELDCEFEWVEIEQTILPLLNAVKSHDAEVMNKIIEGMK